MEDWNTLQSFTFATVILSIFCSIPFLVWAAKRYGKREVLTTTCLFDGAVLFICFFIPPESMKVEGPAPRAPTPAPSPTLSSPHPLLH